MSDKFFFKGRQDVRKNHTGHGFQTKAVHKLGSKKYPLELVVTSEARKQALEAEVAEAQLYAHISIDNDEGAKEMIAELTALLNKASTQKMQRTPARNEPCSCGSGKKYKKCCG
ncbi:MAG: SEC-C domain-containing protein [Gammaproteobacteria bacterium]|nr:SEC-C domain-containing protein [Gammaproteobacteria bacterium]